MKIKVLFCCLFALTFTNGISRDYYYELPLASESSDSQIASSLLFFDLDIIDKYVKEEYPHNVNEAWIDEAKGLLGKIYNENNDGQLIEIRFKVDFKPNDQKVFQKLFEAMKYVVDNHLFIIPEDISISLNLGYYDKKENRNEVKLNYDSSVALLESPIVKDINVLNIGVCSWRYVRDSSNIKTASMIFNSELPKNINVLNLGTYSSCSINEIGGPTFGFNFSQKDQQDSSYEKDTIIKNDDL